MRLIDADDALKQIDGLLRSPFANDKFMVSQYIAVRDTVHLVKALCIGKSPTVDAVPVVHGRWERTRHWWQGGSTWKRCSECGVLNCGESKFCPSCGARMDLPEGEGVRSDG